MKKIDDLAYKYGLSAFAKGKSLRSLVEQMIEASNVPSGDWQENENKYNSIMLGFADALITKIRGR